MPKSKNKSVSIIKILDRLKEGGPGDNVEKLQEPEEVKKPNNKAAMMEKLARHFPLQEVEEEGEGVPDDMY